MKWANIGKMAPIDLWMQGCTNLQLIEVTLSAKCKKAKLNKKSYICISYWFCFFGEPWQIERLKNWLIWLWGLSPKICWGDQQAEDSWRADIAAEPEGHLMTELPLTQGRSAFLHHPGLQLIGWGPPPIWRVTCFSFKVIQTYPHRNTQNNVWPNIWAPWPC